MALSHIVIYEKTGGVIHGIFDINEVGTFVNKTTYLADGFIKASIKGIIWRGLKALGADKLRAVSLDNPTFDSSDFSGYGVFTVDDMETPADTAERVDGGRQITADGDSDSYNYT